MRFSKLKYWIPFWGLLLNLLFSCTSDNAETLYPTNDVEAEAFYESRLKAVIDSKCISCHVYHLTGDSRYDNFEKTKSSIGDMISRINSTSSTVMPPVGQVELTNLEKVLFQEFLDILTSDVEVVDDEEDISFSVNWTAYKYPDRFTNNREGAGVGGTFDEIEYSFNSNYTEIVDVLNNATITINTSSVNVADNEPLRTGNVGAFFAAFTPNIVGTIISYSETEAEVSFEMNGVIESVTLNVEVDENESIVTLSGSIEDMNIFNWNAGYNVLEDLCGDLHENMLWEDVDLEAVIDVSSIELLRDRESLPVDISWTAYKYPDRFTNNREGAGVGGTFNRFEYSLNTEYNDLVDVLDNATVNIVTSSVNVADNDLERTRNVDMFFSAFTPDITGTVVSYSNTEADVRFAMNGISQTVTLAVEVDENQNTVALSGSIEDMNVFDWTAGYNVLQDLCGSFHEDMLWEDVDISVTIRLDEL